MAALQISFEMMEHLVVNSGSLVPFRTCEEINEVSIQEQQIQAAQPNKWKHRRRVAFSNNISIIPLKSPLDWADYGAQEEGKELLLLHRSLWYRVPELLAFRQEARELCRQTRQIKKIQANIRSKICFVLSHLDDDNRDREECNGGSHEKLLRGLEARTCLERQRRKQLVEKCILLAQSRISCPELLGAFCSQCTNWAVQLAREEGQRDFDRAYGSNMNGKKRPPHMDVDDQCCVRPKLS